MAIKKDISSRHDIALFIKSFYVQVLQDETIGIIFRDIVPIKWEEHIPVIVDFWETILFDKPVYKKNAMEVHHKINGIFPLRKEHFMAWLHLFNHVLDDMYSGETATLAKKRAASIASMMEYKMNIENNNR